MGHQMSNRSPLVSFLLGAAMAIVCVFSYMSLDPWTRSVEISSWRMSGNSDSNVDGANEIMFAPNSEVDHAQLAPIEMPQTKDLASLLKSVAMDDNTVILTEVNEAWAMPNSLLDLFLESFRVGEHIEHLLDHLLIVAINQKAFDRCNLVHSHCYLHKMEGNYSSAKGFMSKGYLEIVWNRNKLQQTILELGYNFLFTDVDIIWFRDPLRRIAITPHIAMSSDFFFGDEDSLGNLPNVGLLYVKSCAKTVEFYKNWQLARERFPRKHEQHVLNQLKHEFAARSGVKMQFIDTAYCGGFCQLRTDLNKICTMHANCCVGLQRKLYDLRNIMEDWRKYKALTVEEKRKGEFHWRVPAGECIHIKQH